MQNLGSRRWALQRAGAAVTASALTALGSKTVGAAADQNQPGVYFPETRQTVALDFAQFWLDTAGQTVFGMPITAEYEENGIRVQWFERARFEGWPDQPGVVLPLIADEYFALTGTSPKSHPASAVRSFGRQFPETGFAVHQPFLGFFYNHGGAAIFGYPISRRLLVDGVTVQYFQRARLELHRDGVRIGRLGAELAQARSLALDVGPRRPRSVNWKEIFEESQGTTVDATLGVHGPVLSDHRDAISDMELRYSYFDQIEDWDQKRWLAVSIDKQRVTAFVGGWPIFTDLVSTGKEEKGFTPLGFYSIQYRVYNELMDGETIGLSKDDPQYYRLENVLYTQYFSDAGHAIHYAWWHDNFGSPMSFGCVNTCLSTARFLWRWARIGTPIVIHE